MTIDQLIERLEEIRTENNKDCEIAIRIRMSPRRTQWRKLVGVVAGRIELLNNENYVELSVPGVALSQVNY